MSAAATEIHTALMRFTLCVDECRAYWQAVGTSGPLLPTEAFERYTFGQKSEEWVKITLRNMRRRFDAFPPSLEALHRLDPDPACLPLICHWHTMLADPIYRAFAVWLQQRRELGRTQVSRAEVARWVEQQQPGRWGGTSRNGWASKLLTTAREAGLVQGSRDPRTITLPYVPDQALLYLLHLLRQVTFVGDLLANAYLRSLGLDGGVLTDRLRKLDGVSLQRMGNLVDLGFNHDSLLQWVEAHA